MLETFLLHVDVGAGAAAVRFALGALLVVALHALHPRAGLATAALALSALLFVLKLVTAVGRRLVPATPAVRALWDLRRGLARRYDSFQWRKLLWIGTGILAAAAITPGTGWEPALGWGCVLAGAIAELVWRRKGLTAAPPARG